MDYEAFYNSPNSYRPPKYTEEFETAKKQVKEQNRMWMERTEKEKPEGFDAVANYACSRNKTDYDMGAKDEK